MNCKDRPILVGEPNASWKSGKYKEDYDRYFDLVSFGLKDKLIFPKISDLFHFGYNKFYKKNGKESKHAYNIRSVKKKYWEKGYATQKDANYFAMKILEKYPSIAKTIIFRFHELIIDEAQDTSDVQMRIIDILIKNGLNEIMLVGDPDQAIFEWNYANPKLFEDKFFSWSENSIVLNENRRSSQKICNFTYGLSSLDNPSIAISDDVKKLSFVPEIIIYDHKSHNSVKNTIDCFIKQCKKNRISINNKNVAILYRSKNFISLIDNIELQKAYNNSPWKIKDRFTKDFVIGKYLCDNKKFKEGFKIIEKAIIRILEKKNQCSISDIKERIDKFGFIRHRNQIFNFYKKPIFKSTFS